MEWLSTPKWCQPRGGTKPKLGPNSKRYKNWNFCWPHGNDVSKDHTSATCQRRHPNHQVMATRTNPMGGNPKDNTRTILPSHEGRLCLDVQRQQRAQTKPQQQQFFAGPAQQVVEMRRRAVQPIEADVLNATPHHGCAIATNGRARIRICLGHAARVDQRTRTAITFGQLNGGVAEQPLGAIRRPQVPGRACRDRDVDSRRLVPLVIKALQQAFRRCAL